MDYDIELLVNSQNYNYIRGVSYFNDIDFQEIEKFEKLLNARYCKLGRIKKRFVYLLARYKHIWFCTFTFDNYYINKCTRTKRDLIKNVLNNFDFKYILNVDYGKQTDREHYHCIIATNQDFNVNQFIQFNYPCHCLAIECKTDYNDFVRLTKYIDKLVNHCIKATTKKQRLVYNFKGYDELTISHDKFVIYTKDKIKIFSTQ